MSNNEYKENEIGNTLPILEYIKSIDKQKNELVLTSEGELAGAVLTAEQYSWFLDKIDEYQDLSEIARRDIGRGGEQSLEDFKRELGE